MSLKTWIVTDGKAGTEKQCLALADILNLKPQLKRIQAKGLWKYLPPALWVNPLNGLAATHEGLSPPWPDVIIGSSRIAAAPLAALKRLLGSKITIIYIQNPSLNPANFDFVIAPHHDRLSGPNVVSITGAVVSLKEKDIIHEAAKWKKLLPPLPTPLIAVMLGGNSRHHTMTVEAMENFGALLRRTALKRKMGFLVTPSRRTPPEALVAFKIALGETPAYFWNGLGDNPYLGFLGLADFLLITTDSVSMISEALMTGKPVYTFDLESSSRRLESFISSLKGQGLIRSFEGNFEEFSYGRPTDTETIFQKLAPVLKKMHA